MPVVAVAASLFQQECGPQPLVVARAGEVPVVVTAPNGGRQPLLGAPPRRGDGLGQFVVVNDTNTELLAERKFCDANFPADIINESVGANRLADSR
ncbi:MAG: hypothetical protein MUF18_18095 [Fimbriiglobus sp.]|jgi:hypothetical protein|nr:hypothetical protein [Fimbriiglobus sp.]